MFQWQSNCPILAGTMNIFDKSFSPSEAQLRYLDADYVRAAPRHLRPLRHHGRAYPLDELS